MKKRLFAKGRQGDGVKILFALIFIALVFVPLVQMFAYMDGESLRRVFGMNNLGQIVLNSLTSAVLGTLVTIALAFLIASSVHRTNIRYKSVFGIIFVLPMLIPSISSGMGLVILFGNNGIVTRLLNLKGSIYGLPGIVIGSVMYAFPVAYLMLADVLRYEDGSPYEAAQVLGIPKWRQFTAITSPYLRKPLISIVFSIFTMIITDYGVPLMVGGKYTTISTVMYQEVIGQLNFGKGTVYGAFLLIPAVIAFLIDLGNKDKGNSSYVTKPRKLANSRAAKGAAYGCCIAMGVFVLLPLVAFALLAFATDYPQNLSFTLGNLAKAFKLKAGQYWMNSVTVAAATSVLGTLLAFVTAYLTARMKSPVSRFLHLSAITSAAIPGIVLGLSYVLTFNHLSIYRTMLILVIVNVIHFFASPYLMMYNSLSKINENLENVAQTMGITRVHMIKDVFIPQCKLTLMEMFSYFFVNCMMTISAVSFLANTANKPVSLMINQFEAQMQLECAAVVSLMILLTNLVVKGAFFLARKHEAKKKTQDDRGHKKDAGKTTNTTANLA